jgi:enamine deaminase RidA (YjgF/YER057c/UK114 family)
MACAVAPACVGAPQNLCRDMDRLGLREAFFQLPGSSGICTLSNDGQFRCGTPKALAALALSEDEPNDLCQTVVARGTMVFVRGQIGQTRESVAIGDPGGQAERAMANIDMLLHEAGSKLGHICKITIYIVDPRYREPVYRVVGKWLKGVYPVSTGLVISALARPEWLVEIDVIAVIPG